MHDIDHDPNDPNDPNDAAGDYVFCYDANGNVGQLVDLAPTTWSTDVLVARYAYDPYGNVTQSDGAYADENPIRFSTKYWDDETGFGYWLRRFYDPVLGRWLNRDPIEEWGGHNLYTYILNQPPNEIDPVGEIILPSPSLLAGLADPLCPKKPDNPEPGDDDLCDPHYDYPLQPGDIPDDCTSRRCRCSREYNDNMDKLREKLKPAIIDLYLTCRDRCEQEFNPPGGYGGLPVMTMQQCMEPCLEDGELGIIGPQAYPSRNQFLDLYDKCMGRPPRSWLPPSSGRPC